MDSNPSRQQLISWIIFIFLALVWGSSFILMKTGMQAFGSNQLATLRLVFAGLAALPLTLTVGRSIPRKDWGWIVVSGLLGSGIPAYLFCIAETHLDSGVAGVLNATTPVFTIITGILFFKSRIKALQALGVTIGFGGVLLLMMQKGLNFSTELHYAGYILVATFCYGLNVNVIRHKLSHLSSLQIASVSFFSLMVMAIPVLVYTFQGFTWQAGPVLTTSLLSAAALGIMGTTLSSILFYRLIKQSGPMLASMVTYCIPIVALAWGRLAGESVGLIHLLALSVILFGVYLVNRQR
jgi:drug/metabolite transporter (DMT)-like permease